MKHGYTAGFNFSQRKAKRIAVSPDKNQVARNENWVATDEARQDRMWDKKWRDQA